MHHYCTVTCSSLTFREDARHVWRSVIPTEAYSNRYLMHGILAIAAVHRAYLFPTAAQKEKYIKASAYHLAAGLKEFRELIASPIDPENWQPVFCFAAMITIHLCTVPVRLGGSKWPNPIANMIELFASMKGLQAITKPFLPSMGRTPLAPMANSVWLESEMRVHRLVTCSLRYRWTLECLSSCRSLIIYQPLPRCTISLANRYLDPNIPSPWLHRRVPVPSTDK